MKKSLTIFITILLASCAQKQFYTVCPVEVPKAWKKAPNGSLQYRRLAKGIYDCKKESGVCSMLFSDFQTISENMGKCEHARSSLVDLFDAVSTPKTPAKMIQESFDKTDPDAELPEELKNVPISN